MKRIWLVSLISVVVGIAIGAGLTAMIARQSNSAWLIRPALVSSELKDRKSEYLLQGPGWHLPLKVMEDKSELRLFFPGSGLPAAPPAVNLWVGKDGVRSVSVANSSRHGVMVSKSNKSTGLFDELVVHTPSNSGNQVVMKVDSNLDGVFERDVVSDK